MTGDTRAIVARTLRFLAEGWIRSEDDRRWLTEAADAIERGDPAEDLGWACCPLCAETVCDEGCPLGTVRAG